jgi:hypothetical protein
MAKFFTLTLRGASGRDATRDLRGLLKMAWRQFHLRAVTAREVEFRMHQRPMHSMRKSKRAFRRRCPVDIRQFRKPKFLKIEDIRASGPREDGIVGVKEGKFEKPDLLLESGDMIGLSATNIDVLAREYGWETKLWSGHAIRLVVGQGESNDKPVDMVLIEPISKAEKTAEETSPTKRKAVKPPPAKPDFDDEVTF